jgi:Coenzyme PQQ synthesis protein D (PqqD)
MRHPVADPAVSVRRRPDVVARRVGETAVLVHLGSNRIYELNDTGARIWELASEGSTVQCLIDRLEREFDVDRGQLASEVMGIVGDLVGEGLFEDRSNA